MNTRTRGQRGSNLTVSEIETLRRELINYPTNLKYAFNKAAELTGRSFRVLQNAYYRRLKEREDFVVITAGSQRGFSHNVKNSHVDENGNLPNYTLNSVQWLMRELLLLPEEERQTILNFFIESSNVEINNK